MRKLRNLVVLLGLFYGLYVLTQHFLLSPPVAPVAMIASISGANAITVTTASGSHKQLATGQSLSDGDSLETGTSTVRIAYPDLANIVVDANSKVTAGSNTEDSESAHLSLQTGLIRVVVKPGPEQTKPRFIIRTRTATLGVRGTDFIVDSGAAAVSLYTLSGKVAIAKDGASLINHQGEIEVKEGQATFSSESKPVQPVMPFNKWELLQRLHSKNPAFEKLSSEATHEVAQMKASAVLASATGSNYTECRDIAIKVMLTSRHAAQQAAQQNDTQKSVETADELGKRSTALGCDRYTEKILNDPELKKTANGQ